MGDWDVVSQTPIADQTASPSPGSQDDTSDPWSVVAQTPADQAPISDPSALGSLARGAIREALPTTAAVGGGELANTLFGARLGEIAGPIGAIVGAGAGAFGGGWLASKGQDWVMDKLGLKNGTGTLTSAFNPAQEQADTQQHPYTTMAGGLLDMLLSMGTGNPQAVSKLTRALGGAIMGAGEAGQEVYNNGSVDPTKVLLAAGAGAAAPVPREWVTSASGRAAGALARFKGTGTGAIQNPVQTDPAAAGRPDIGGAPADGASKDDIEIANDLTTTAPGVAAENPATPTVEGAGNPVGAPMDAREASDPSAANRDYRKGAPPAAAQAIETTPSQPTISIGNVDPTVSAALTQAQPQAPTPDYNEIPPFLNRNAPGGPGQAPAPQPPAPAQLAARAARNRAIQQAVQEPAPAPEAAPAASTPQLHPEIAKIVDTPPVQAAMAQAAKRPIVETPMPSGANSSKDINGPVYVDPRIPAELRPFLGIHETVEQMLMDKGATYNQAHQIATAAEHAAVVRAGIDWDQYTKTIDGFLKATEKEKPGNLPTDLHVNPEAADNAATHHLDKNAILKALTEPAEAPVTASVTAPVTPAPAAPVKLNPRSIALVKRALDYADQNNMPKLSAAIRNATPDEQIAIARKFRTLTRSRPTANGVLAGSPQQAAERTAALDAMKQAFIAHPNANPDLVPTSAADKQALIDRLGAIQQHAEQAVGGNPLDVYKPRVKPPEWQLYNKAMKVLAKPTPKNINDYISAEKLLQNGGAADVQATNRIAGDIANNRTPVNEETPGAEPHIERETFEPIPVPEEDFVQSNGRVTPIDNSYINAQNDLRDWVNGLSNSDYQALAENYDLRNELDQPSDPAQLLVDMKQTLTSGQRGLIEPHETPGVKLLPEQVRTPTAPLGESEGAANAGRSLKGTPEFEKLAAQYGGMSTKPTPVPGTLKGAQDAAIKFIGNESGAGKLMPFLFPQPKNPIAERVAQDLSHQFNINEGTIANMDGRLGAAWAAAQGHLTDAERVQLYRKLQDKSATLNPREQDFVDRFYKPLADWQQRLINLARKRGMQLPPDYSAGKVNMVPRVRVPDQTAPVNDMPWRRDFSSWAAGLQDRDFFALDDGTGTRLIFKMDENGNPEIINNGRTTVLKKNVPPSFTGAPGEQLPLSVGGKSRMFTVDHAMTPEITAATGIKYAEDPIIAQSNSIRSIQAALSRDNMLDRIKSNVDVQHFSTTDLETANKLGYRPTVLPQLAKDTKSRTVYYDPRFQQLFDDFVKPGFGNVDSLQEVRNFGQNAAKPLYFLSPTFHVLNIAAQHFIGTAALMARAGTLKPALRILPDLANAYKDVLTQGPIQREMRSVGGRTMYASQLFDGGVIQHMMQDAGIQITQRPGLWANFARATGVPVDAWSHTLMRGSNKIMWAGNDILQTSLYNTARRAGLTPEQAIEATGRYIGTYRADNPTFMGSRWAQQILNEPAFSWFGPYHQDLWNSLGTMYKNIVNPQNPADQREAIGAVAALGFLTYAIYPYILDPFAQWLTGNKGATLGRRGLAALADLPRQIFEGQPNGYERLGDQIFTPSIPVNTLWQLLHNQDWKGQHIFTPGAPALTQGVQGADFVVRSVVPPYAQIAQLARRGGTSVGSILRKMGESTVGLNEPSEAAQRYTNQQAKHNATELRERRRHPEGFIESLANRL